MSLSRSEQMARIRSTDTQPEKLLRAALWKEGQRYRLHYRLPNGKADLVFPGSRLAVFVDGCFWHGCPEHYVRPRSRREFWAKKLRENVERDIRQTATLEANGWCVLRFWEHEVFTCVASVVSAIKARRCSDEETSTQLPQPRVIAVATLNEATDFERWTLVDLRNPEIVSIRERIRSTRKW